MEGWDGPRIKKTLCETPAPYFLRGKMQLGWEGLKTDFYPTHLDRFCEQTRIIGRTPGNKGQALFPSCYRREFFKAHKELNSLFGFGLGFVFCKFGSSGSVLA
jgi:hypothetical protein